MSENQTEKQIIFLDPVCTHNIWGGVRLKEDFGFTASGNDIGECWGISAHPNGDGIVKSGGLSGKKLSEVWKERPKLFGNLSCGRFPLLVKFIDAKEDLSVQVHPDDIYARLHEGGPFGKTECWYILDCPENATLVIGHNAKTKEELRTMISEGRWNELLREVPVNKGDFLQIDPGTLHAIKGGFLVLETQQSSDITYRVYDYDRLSNGKPRELHVEKSIDVITVPAKPLEEILISTACMENADGEPLNQLRLLYTCEFYRIYKLKLKEEAHFLQRYPFLNVTVTEGAGTVNGYEVKKGDNFILPFSFGDVFLRGNMELIASTVNSDFRED